MAARTARSPTETTPLWAYAILLVGVVLLLVLAYWIFAPRVAATFTPQEVHENGSMSVTMCPACEVRFMGLIKGGGDIECALYDFSPAVADVLRADHARVVTDVTGGSYGQKIKQDGLMHDKFCVINGTTVTTGSYNPTADGELNRNNLVVIESRTLAHNYDLEFKAIAARNTRGTIPHVVWVNDTRIENYFCPEDSCESHVVAALAHAQHNITYMIYSFTSDAIAKTLLEREAAGVAVHGICDGTEYKVAGGDCASLNASVWRGPALLHHKVFIIDGTTVVTGSYNPTGSGDHRNAENIIILTNPDIASQYLAEYEAVLAAQQVRAAATGK